MGPFHIRKPTLIKRINRQLLKDHLKLRKTRVPVIDLGDYYIQDIKNDKIVEHHMTNEQIEKLANKLGVLDKYTRIA